MAEVEDGPDQAGASTMTTTMTPAPSFAPCVEVPSFEAAQALMESHYSCLVATGHRRHIALPPRFLCRKRTGIRAQLDAELRRFSESFQGVPVAYDDIKITNELGDIIDDIGAVHLDVEANFVIFQPKPGKKLVGTINKIAPSHIGCLVHGCFNASIPKPDYMSADEWKNLGFQIGNRLIFKVLCFDSDSAGVFCIRGKLCRKSTGKELPKEKHKKKHDNPCDTQNSTEEMELDIATTGVEEMQNNYIDNGIYDMPENVDGQERADLGLPASDSSGYYSDHGKSKKKRRKLSEEENGLPGLLKPKTKKNRKE
ncbi:DNA-directed RNA polymerase I subunit RPA43 [Rhineura floridana]|uniref:DNA-directed RNA polymerase I subunit RPA43 n=1 Tax=Rhineura floridana TaxID=261503 RepID=UPI002AC85158|nr:DNA-directed RNA polymerase I subunit RPA43 [Rhineura floridana]